MTQTAVHDQQKAAAKPRKRKRLYRVLWALLALVVGVCSYWSWSYYSALAERDALIAELRAKGEPVWWNEIAGKALAGQSEDSGADLFLKAIWELGGDFNRSKPWLPSSTLEDTLKIKYPEPTILPEVEAELKAAAPAFALAKQAVQKKPGLLTKNLRTDNPAAILLPHIQNIRGLARMLRWEAYDALARHDPRRAYNATILSLRCSEQLAAEPIVISQLVRWAVSGAACNQLEMCLSYAPPNSDEFRILDELLSAHDDGFGLHRPLAAERAMDMSYFEGGPSLQFYLSTFSRFRSSASPQQQWIKDQWFRVVASPAGFPARIRTESDLLRLFRDIEPLVDKPNVDPADFEEMFADFVRRSPVHRLVPDSDPLTIGTLRSFPRAIIRVHRRLIFARLALRLRRYYDQHGKFPERLDELCDETMPKIRIDWFQNHPITYKPSARGFRLETPAAIIKPEDRHVLDKTPILSDYGLELELKKLP